MTSTFMALFRNAFRTEHAASGRGGSIQQAGGPATVRSISRAELCQVSGGTETSQSPYRGWSEEPVNVAEQSPYRGW